MKLKCGYANNDCDDSKDNHSKDGGDNNAPLMGELAMCY